MTNRRAFDGLSLSDILQILLTRRWIDHAYHGEGNIVCYLWAWLRILGVGKRPSKKLGRVPWLSVNLATRTGNPLGSLSVLPHSIRMRFTIFYQLITGLLSIPQPFFPPVPLSHFIFHGLWQAAWPLVSHVRKPSNPRSEIKLTWWKNSFTTNQVPEARVPFIKIEDGRHIFLIGIDILSYPPEKKYFFAKHCPIFVEMYVISTVLLTPSCKYFAMYTLTWARLYSCPQLPIIP